MSIDSTPASFTARPDAEQHTAELVVLGAGGSGIAAALAAAERGVTVLLVEKGNKPGGAAMFGATGFAAYGSAAQQAAGETFGVREAFQAITEYNRCRCNMALVRAVVGRSGETVEWLEGHGLRTQLVEHGEAALDPSAGGDGVLCAHRAARTYHRYVSKFGGFKKMLASFERLGGRLLTETAATELVTGPDGEILGVRALKTDAGTPLAVSRALSAEARRSVEENDGAAPVLVDIAASAVVIATGGYVGNLDLVQEDLGRIPGESLHFTGERKSVGTGRELAQAVGGDHLARRTLDIPSFTVPGRYSSKSLAVLANLPLLWVDDGGKRFADESVTYRFGQRGAAVFQQGGHFWMILDSETVEQLSTTGLRIAPAEEHGAPRAPDASGTPPQPQIFETLGEAVDAGAAFMGLSVEELAGAAGFPAVQFARTVEEYNRAVDSGVDELFFTPTEVLQHAVRSGPFYAVKVVTTVRGTLGGLRIDEGARLLSPEGAPVPGVFAAGNEATGFFGDTYPQIDGLTLAFAFTSGRIAGESAADLLGRPGGPSGSE